MKRKIFALLFGLFFAMGNIFAADSSSQDFVQHFSWGLIGTIVFALIGIVMVVVSFKVIDKITPGDMAKQIAEEKNVALAIVYGSSILGISIIIAAAIAG